MNGKAELFGKELALLAHEIREPLASILFAVDCANQGGDERLSSRQICEIVERQARYMAGVIEDILDASQAEHGRLPLHKELIDVRGIVETAIETNVRQFRNRDHRLMVSLPHGALLMIADGRRLQQVVNNLLTNACKYTPPGGRISVAAEIEGDTIGIVVRDNGVGIRPEDLPRVFDLFHQGPDKSRGGFPGLGLGLALVKLLVELHGGNVTAVSAGRGFGSSFIVRLPGATTVSSASPNPPELSPAPQLIDHISRPGAACRRIYQTTSASQA